MPEIIKVGFPLSAKHAETEKYATLTIDGYEARFAMTGLDAILNALRHGRRPELLSDFVVVDAIKALTSLHERMWELCDADDALKGVAPCPKT